MKYVEGKAFLDNFGLGMEEDLLRRLKRGIEEFINLCFEQMPPELKLSYVEEYLNDVNNFSRGVGPRTKNPLNLRLYINTFNDGHTNGIMYDVSLFNFSTSLDKASLNSTIRCFSASLMPFLIRSDKLTSYMMPFVWSSLNVLM